MEAKRITYGSKVVVVISGKKQVKISSNRNRLCGLVNAELLGISEMNSLNLSFVKEIRSLT